MASSCCMYVVIVHGRIKRRLCSSDESSFVKNQLTWTKKFRCNCHRPWPPNARLFLPTASSVTLAGRFGVFRGLFESRKTLVTDRRNETAMSPRSRRLNPPRHRQSFNEPLSLTPVRVNNFEMSSAWCRGIPVIAQLIKFGGTCIV